VDTPWYSRNARLDAPAGVLLTLYQELRPGDGTDLVGTPVADLGGEPGLLGYTVRLATDLATRGSAPFAAVVVRDGRLIGAGVNTVVADSDPTAHGEVTAIRDAARRTGSPDLAGAVLYSSCEPCALCRTAAVAAGVREIVYAAGRQAVPAAIDPDPAASGQAMDALAPVWPGLVRRGASGMSDEAVAGAPTRRWMW
jgi:tRNA(Arg) A34 adenosine deaminase TadA